VIIHDVAQGTAKWLALRAGIPTASCFDKIITPGGKASTSAKNYMNLLLAERIMGHPAETFQSEWMSRGNEFEQKAVDSYEFQKDCQTVQIGFITNDDGSIGCSPDRGIVDNPKGGLETKCPSPQVHVTYMLAATGAANEYRCQLQGQLWICEWEWVDILSYHPEMPEALFRVYRDDDFIKELSAHVLSFSRQLEEKSSDFTERGWIKLAAEETKDPTAGFISDDDLEWAKKHYTERELGI